MSARIELIKPCSYRPGLSESKQIDLIEKIAAADMPPNDIRSVLADPNRLVLLDRGQSSQGEKKERARSSDYIGIFPCQ
jgi:hypothetical protein